MLPWEQLTSLDLCTSTVHVNQSLSILQQTTNLLYLKLTIWFGYYHIGPNITLPCLQTLVLRSFASGLAGFLVTLVVPALLRLEISETFLGSNPIESLASFISKSLCKLHTMWYERAVAPRTRLVALTARRFPPFQVSLLNLMIDWDAEHSG